MLAFQKLTGSMEKSFKVASHGTSPFFVVATTTKGLFFFIFKKLLKISYTIIEAVAIYLHLFRVTSRLLQMVYYRSQT